MEVQILPLKSTPLGRDAELHIAYFFGCKTEFFLPKQSQKSRSMLKDGSRSLELFVKLVL